MAVARVVSARAVAPSGPMEFPVKLRAKKQAHGEELIKGWSRAKSEHLLQFGQHPVDLQGLGNRRSS